MHTHRDDYDPRRHHARPAQGWNRRPPRPDRLGRPPPLRKPSQPKGPATFAPVVPATRKQWKAMYSGTVKRLSRLLARHAHELLSMDAHQLMAAAEALQLKAAGRRGRAIRLARKLERLRVDRPDQR